MVRKIMLMAAFAMCWMVVAHAQEAMTPAHRHHAGGVHVVVTHEVKDYTAWRKVFDEDGPNRKGAGFHVMGVFVDTKNPRMVSVIGDFADAAAAEKFFSSPKLKAAMEKGGVVGQPDIKVLEPKP